MNEPVLAPLVLACGHGKANIDLVYAKNPSHHAEFAIIHATVSLAILMVGSKTFLPLSLPRPWLTLIDINEPRYCRDRMQQRQVGKIFFARDC